MQSAIYILRPKCTTGHHGDSLWQVLKNFDGNCRRSYEHKKLLTDGWTDQGTFLGEELVGSNCSLFNATPQVDFLTQLIPNPNPIPTRWTESNPIETTCTLTLTSQCQPKGKWRDDPRGLT